MRCVLLFLFAVAAVVAQPPPQGAANPPPASPQTGVALKMQPALDKQRESIRRQSSGLLTLGEVDPNDGFLLPWPRTAPAAGGVGATPVSATDASLRYMMDSLDCPPMNPAEMDLLVNQSAAREGVDPKLVRAVIAQESAGRPCSVSRAGAQGLMQLMPEVQRDFGVNDAFNPAQSIEAGVKLLRSLLDRYGGDLPKALAAYNAGPAAVDRAGGIPPIRETENYVTKIVQRIQ